MYYCTCLFRLGVPLCGLAFSFLCGCHMMFGLLPRIYHHNFVSYISLKFICFNWTFVSYLHFFAWLFFQGIFVYYATNFSLVKFLSFSFGIFRFDIIFGSSSFSFLVSPKIITFAKFESLFSFSSRLAQVFVWQNPISSKFVLWLCSTFRGQSVTMIPGKLILRPS